MDRYHQYDLNRCLAWNGKQEPDASAGSLPPPSHRSGNAMRPRHQTTRTFFLSDGFPFRNCSVQGTASNVCGAYQNGHGIDERRHAISGQCDPDYLILKCALEWMQIKPFCFLLVPFIFRSKRKRLDRAAVSSAHHHRRH